jgi:hypothetical protein
MVFQLADAQQLGPQRLFVARVAIFVSVASLVSLAAEDAAHRLDGRR